MKYITKPPSPGITGIKFPKASRVEAVQASFGEEAETVCSLSLWRRVNRRRKVCGLPPLTKDQRSAKDLAIGLLEMRLFWVRGEDWDENQPGDDPVLVNVTNRFERPCPRTVLARISYEGVAIWRELRVPKMDFDSMYTEFGFRRFRTKHKSTTKSSNLTTRTSNTVGTFTVESGHGLTVGQVVDVMWRQATIGFMPRAGCRIGVSITNVTGNSVKIEGGRGDKLPGPSDKCFFMTNPANTITVHIWRRDPNPTCAGVARVVERMKYTGTGRGINTSKKSSDKLKYFNTGNTTGNLQGVPGNTINQWDNELFGVDAVLPNGSHVYTYTTTKDSFWNSAIKYDEFINLSTGLKLNAILRLNFPDSDSGMFLQYIQGTRVVRALTVQGLKWDGIIYGEPNPEIFDGEGPAIVLEGDDPWVPVEDNHVTDFPYLLGAREYYSDSTTSAPFGTSWMSDYTENSNFTTIEKGEDYSFTTFDTDDDPYNHGTYAIADFNVYAFMPDFLGSGQFNSDPPGELSAPYAIVSSWVPTDMEGCPSFTGQADLSRTLNDFQQSGYICGDGSGLVDTAAPNTGSLLFLTPTWSREINNLIGAGAVPIGIDYVTDETVLRRVSSGQAPVPDDILEIASTGIGPRPLTAYFTMGWKNILCDFNIIGAMNGISIDLQHEFKNRIAEIGVDGHGVANFQFNNPDYAEYNAKIFIWRKRNGIRTIKRYGPNLYTASMKDYVVQEGLALTGGVTIVGPYTSVSSLVITEADIEATATTDVEELTSTTDILEWDNDKIGGGLPNLALVAEGLTNNYIASTATLSIGEIYSVSTAYKDFYTPFIKYNFNDSNTGHEDNDGYPPGVKPV